MRASIVIPVLNEADIVAQCLSQLQHLRDHHIELIVVDGGSKDSTVLLANSMADKIITSAYGRAAQMNAGLEQTTGDYIFFLHADTQLPTNFIQCLELIEKNQFSWGFFQARLDASNWYFRVIEYMMNLRSTLSSIGTGDQVLFFRQSHLTKVNGYPLIPIMEDIALSKIAREKFGRAKVISHPVVTSARRWQQDGVIKTIMLMWRLRWSYFRGVSPEQLSTQYSYNNSSSR